ncbi:hypothetical protein PENTCL1PPCAC_6276, partial [Pristionchus entomophagus]
NGPSPTNQSPTKSVPVGTNGANVKQPLTQPSHLNDSKAINESTTTNQNSKLTSTTNQASPAPTKVVNTFPSTMNPPGTVPKSVPASQFIGSTPNAVPASNLTGKGSKPIPSSPQTVAVPKAIPASVNTNSNAAAPPSKRMATSVKTQVQSNPESQKTSNQSSKPKLTLDPKLTRSPSKRGKISLISQSSPSPPIDKDIPNLPADRPIRGVDPVFAVAEMINEEIPVKNPDEIMSTRKEICANTGGAIGNTPLVMLNSIGKGLPGKIAVKLEYMNPAGSVKDRVGYAMIEDAEKKGLITPGKTVLIEATSGNMGIALAFVARIKGYKLILCMPASMSVERRSLLKAYGAEVVLTDPATAVKGALQRANELKAAIPHAHILNQFGNSANVKAHYDTTGPEVWEQTNGKVDIICYGVGSGGTLSGVGKYLKEKKPSVEVFPVEPFESSVINGLAHSPHKIQGMGTGFIPEILDKTLFSEALRVHSDDAIAMAKRLATEEAILGGISSGANVCAAVELATRPENEGKLIVTNINSFGERYLSTTLYSDIREAAEKLKMMSLDESLDIAQKYVAVE